jgi:hypothetical protein
VNRRHKEASVAGELAQNFVAVLMKVDDMIFLRHGRSWMLKRLINVEGFSAVLLKLLGHRCREIRTSFSRRQPTTTTSKAVH